MKESFTPVVADFRLIETGSLTRLVEVASVRMERRLFSRRVIDHYPDVLNSLSPELIGFRWDGGVFATLLVFLSGEKGIDLLQSEHHTAAIAISNRRRNSITILTRAHRDRYFDALDSTRFSVEELEKFNLEFSGRSDENFVKGELAGIDALRRALELLNDDKHVILLSVGTA